MKYRWTMVATWTGAYLLLVLAFLALALVGPGPDARPYWVEVGVGLGFAGMGVLVAQFVTSGRWRAVAPAFGSDVVLQFHRRAGLLGMALVLAHPLVLVIAEPDFWAYFDPRENLPRALALTAVVPALVLLVVTSLWRERLRISYEWWRAGHGVLSLMVVFVGMVHGLQVGQHLEAGWKRAAWTAALLGAMYLVVHVRVVRPLLMKRRPYRVAEVAEEASDTSTLALLPEGHPGMSFEAGQFAWLTIGDTPFSLQQHPFSFSSSARDPLLRFTAKAVGDFTSTWSDVEPGTTVFLEGPFGGFTLDHDARGAVMVAGGIGVTPMMSILRTMADEGDERPALLLYGVAEPDDVAFADELEDLERKLDLTVVIVPEEAPDGWDGPSGFIDADVMMAHLPADARNHSYYLCGPEPMMDAVETLLRESGLSWRQIHTERFQVV